MNNHHKKEEPLVSIIVMTYNSANYVFETLVSIWNQTYHNIELIITDDCSIDNTVEICTSWIEEHQSRFFRTEIVRSTKNSGIAANCNQGLSKANGDWVKFIAGDDLLKFSAIDKYVKRVLKQPEIQFLFAKVDTFGQSNITTHNGDFWDKMYPKFNELNTVKKQYSFLKYHYNFIPAATSFINKKAIVALNGFDETIPFLEDYPLWLKATKAGYKMYFLEEVLASYRASENSVQVSPVFEFSQFLFMNKYVYYNPLYKIFGNKLDGLNIQSTVNKQFVPVVKIGAFFGPFLRKLNQLLLYNS